MTSADTNPRRGFTLSLQWQLLAVVLCLVAVAAASMALLVHRAAEQAFHAQALRDLESARDHARRSIEGHFQQFGRDLALVAGDPRLAEALGAFARAGRQLEIDDALQGDRIRPQMLRLRDHLLAYYAAELEAEQLRLETLLVPQRAAVWLQAVHLAGGGESAPAPAAAVPDVYAVEHAVWHPLLLDVAEQRGWEDLILVEADEGRVVYTSAKTPVFQTGLLDGPYAISALGSLFRELRGDGAEDDVRFTDFAPFVPLHGRPTAFAATPIVSDGVLVGVLAAQLPPQRVAALLAAPARPHGDIAIRLVGADAAPRLESEKSAASREASSFPRALLRAEAGATTSTYLHRGAPRLGAAAPVSVAGPAWSVVAEMGESDALRPLYRLRSTLLGASAIVLALASALALGAVAFVVRPLRRLLDVLRSVSPGETTHRAGLGAGNELAALGRGVDILIDRQEQWRTQEAAERVRREQEIHELVSVLQAASRGDLSRRARVDGQLAGLANAVNATCVSIGELTERLCAVPPRVVETGTTIQSTAEQMLRDAVRHADDVAAAARSSEHLDRCVRQSAEVAAAAAERVRLVEGAARALDDAVRTMAAGFARLHKSVGATSGRVKRLGDRSMEHASLVGSIAKISADLGMLSLNAAIEASRAAQPGNGFSLVAEEVRKIAERAEVARDEIGRAVEALQAELSEAQAAMGRQAEHVERHAERVAAAQSILPSILEAARECAAAVAGAARDTGGAAGETASLQTTLVDCRDAAKRIRTIAEETHGHAQTLLAIAADLPARTDDAERANGGAAELRGKGRSASDDPRRGGARA